MNSLTNLFPLWITVIIAPVKFMSNFTPASVSLSQSIILMCHCLQGRYTLEEFIAVSLSKSGSVLENFTDRLKTDKVQKLNKLKVL